MEDEDIKDSSGKTRKIHQPEFIILEGKEDEEAGKKSSSYSLHQEYIELLQKLGNKNYSPQVRFLTFFAALILGVSAIVIALLSIIPIILAGFSLFRVPELNAQMFKAFKRVKKVLVLTLGMLIGVFSPPLGFGLILLYFMMLGESLNQTIVSKVFRTTDEN